VPGDSERYWGRGLRRLFSTRHPPAFGSVACSICQGGAIEGRSFPCSSPLALHLSRDLSQSQEQKRLLGNGLPPPVPLLSCTDATTSANCCPVPEWPEPRYDVRRLPAHRAENVRPLAQGTVPDFRLRASRHGQIPGYRNQPAAHLRSWIVRSREAVKRARALF